MGLCVSSFQRHVLWALSFMFIGFYQSMLRIQVFVGAQTGNILFAFPVRPCMGYVLDVYMEGLENLWFGGDGIQPECSGSCD